MIAAAFPAGCPSGLEPAAAPDVVDPAPFVRKRNGVMSLELAVFGAKCGGCIVKIEKGVGAVSGVESARLNLSTGKLVVTWRDRALKPRAIMEALAALGYRAQPFDPEKVADDIDKEGRALLRALAVAGFATANVMLLSVSIWAGLDGDMDSTTRALLHWVSALIAVPSALYAGQPFFRSAATALKGGRANMDVPISLAIILALTLSLYETAHDGEHAYFDAAVMLLFFLLIGRWLDHRLRLQARAAALDLLALQSPTATRFLPDGGLEAVAARLVAPGDALRLAPGDRAPVDCEIVTGESDVDVSLVTGESRPSRKSVGATLHAGVLNLSAPLVVRALKTADESLLADLARLIEAGEQSRSRYRRLADRAAAAYVPMVHSLAAATFLAWYFIADAGLRTALMNAIAVLIITCPCALALAAPAVQVVATGRLFRSGVLVKSGDALERLAETDMIVFDKTGTLTHGRQRIANAAEISAETLNRAAMLARTSRHPLSRAIVAAAGPGPVADNVVERPGEGVEGVIGGAPARLGRADFVGAAALGAAKSAAWFKLGDAPPVRFLFDDEIRADASATIAALRTRGLDMIMLSGDEDAPARTVADALGIPYTARLQPAEKIARLTTLAASGRKVAMVGDGLNDAPSLAAAHASLSPGTAADAAQAAADLVYQGAGLEPIVEAVDVARVARKRMIENFAFAALYNVLAVPLAALGHVTPLIAAIAMSGSSLVVTLNALRLAQGAKTRSPALRHSGTLHDAALNPVTAKLRSKARPA